MKVISEPTVTLVSRQQFIAPEHIDWRSDSENGAEALSEFSGRLCYLSFGDGEIDGHKTQAGRTNNAEYLENILKVGHGSVLEHAVWSLLLEGVSRSLSHELVRHRAGFGFSQLSQRYVDESQVAFVLPPEIEESTPAYRLWWESMRSAVTDYVLLTDILEETVPQGVPKTEYRKRVRQTARSVLPNSTETKLVVTGNARSWRHFVEMRAHPAADREIRRLAVEIFRVLSQEAPGFFQGMSVEHLPDETLCVQSGHRKV